MKASVIIPWRTDHGPRERAWQWLCPRWGELDVELIVEVDDQPDRPFNRSRLVNRAVTRAEGDILVMAGADHVPNRLALAWAGHHLAEGRQWVPMYDSVGYISQVDTDRLIAGEATLDEVEDWHVVPHATGPLALWRSAFEAIGGMDERFEGWGYEDAAMRSVLATLYGKLPAQNRLRCLWHPSTHRSAQGPNRELFLSDYAPLQGKPVPTAEFIASVLADPTGARMLTSTTAPEGFDWILPRVLAEMPGTVLVVGDQDFADHLRAHDPDNAARILTAAGSRRLPSADVVLLAGTLAGFTPEGAPKIWEKARRAARKTMLATVPLTGAWTHASVHALGDVVASSATNSTDNGIGCYAVTPA